MSSGFSLTMFVAGVWALYAIYRVGYVHLRREIFVTELRDLRDALRIAARQSNGLADPSYVSARDTFNGLIRHAARPEISIVGMLVSSWFYFGRRRAGIHVVAEGESYDPALREAIKQAHMQAIRLTLKYMCTRNLGAIGMTALLWVAMHVCRMIGVLRKSAAWCDRTLGALAEDVMQVAAQNGTAKSRSLRNMLTDSGSWHRAATR